jgi:ribosomal protein L11 methyltransferase
MHNNPEKARFFLKLTLKGPVYLAEAVGNLLFEWGCLGIEERTGEVWAYFPGEKDSGDFRNRLKAACQNALQWTGAKEAIRLRFEQIPAEDWQTRWREHFVPVFVGRTWVIRPSWRNVEAPGRIQLVIDPQQAFGTGTHETTQLILECLEDRPVPGKKVLDVGTGTGILAIAAAHLGATKVVAFDVDPVAVQTAAENARINGVEETIRLFVADRPALLQQRIQFDWILMNIQSNIILSLLPDLIPLLAESEAEMLLSGILAEEKEQVKQAIMDLALGIREERCKGEWVCLSAVRNI